MNKKTISIRGMHCASCEILVGEQLKKVPNVAEVKVSQKLGQAEVHYRGNAPAVEALAAAVAAAGYELGEKDKLPWISRRVADYKDLARAAIILYVIYLIAKWFNLFSLDVGAQKNGVIVALFVGLVAGVSTCMALVGGLVLSLSARHAEKHPEATAMQKFRPHVYFNIGRIAGYTALGGLVGLIGAAFQPSSNLLGFLTMVVGGVMIFFGLKLIEVFPVLRDKNIALPASIARLFGLNKEIKEYSPKSSLITGALTFFLPCGFTQAMQLYAVSTGSFWQGAAIMGLFALGTAPGLLGIGGLTSVFKGRKARIFYMAAGLAVIILGWFNITNGSRLFGAGTALANTVEVGQSSSAVMEVRMTQGGSGYSPNVFTVQKGRPVKWIINSTSQFTCAASLVMPKFGISKQLRAGENVITFTPTEVGEIPFSCSMGMYRGKFIVTDNGGTVSSASASLPAGAGASCSVAGGSGGSGGCGGGCGGGKSLTPVAGTAVSASAADGNYASNVQVLKTVYTYDTDISPNTFTVKKNQPVRLEIDVKENAYGCMSAILVPGLYDTPELLSAGRTVVMNFTPTRIGDYPITCSMGVPRGVVKVID